MISLVNILVDLVGKANLPIFDKLNFSDLKLNYDQVVEFFGQFNNFFSKLGATFNIFFQIFSISIMSFYMMNDKKNFYKKFYWFTRDEIKIKKIKNFFIRLEKQLGGWVRGELILMITIAIITYIGLLIFGLPYALPLAILAGLLEALPGIGPTLASIPSIAFAMFLHKIGSIDLMYGVFIGIFYFGVQQVENTFLVPKIMSDNTEINPLVSLVSILIGFEVGGVFGALLALPTFIIIRCIYQTYNEITE
jgi:predicted PurR-regulated permease PerM